MFISYKFKNWFSWPLIRAHLCTLAVSLSFNSTWRAPRDGFRYGGLAYSLVLTVAMITVALPVTLLQLAIGQLSQHDAVGVWRAVPFFRGVGYLRLLVSYIGSIYSSIYVALTTTYLFYTASHSIPFWDCMEVIAEPELYGNPRNASECLNETFMSPIKEKPEYYMAVALILFVLWIVFPFLFYSPVKYMKRIFYVLGPAVLIFALTIISVIGSKENITSFSTPNDWLNYLQPHVWHGAIVQALLSSQVAGGYLMSAGDSIYSSTNVQWTTLVIIGANILSSWAGLIFWFTLSIPEGKDTGMVAVLVQIYATAYLNELSVAWPLCMYAVLFLSGVITMLTLLYPVYDRVRRIGGIRWRVISFTASAITAGISLGVLSGRLPALHLLEDTALPFLISIATVLEIMAFVFIYGWKILVEDVEFLTGRDLPRYWVWGWCAAPAIIVPITLWWLVILFIQHTDWTEPPWEAITVVATFGLAVAVFILFAGVSVARQVQYDVFGKDDLRGYLCSFHYLAHPPITAN